MSVVPSLQPLPPQPQPTSTANSNLSLAPPPPAAAILIPLLVFVPACNIRKWKGESIVRSNGLGDADEISRFRQ